MILSRKTSVVVVVVLCCLATFAPLTQSNSVPVQIKDGFYKVTNIADGSVLTATRKGSRPHEVITDSYQNAATQQWKVKSKPAEGFQAPLQIIRNEQIRENEITKEPNYEPNGRDFIPLFWNFISDPSGRRNVYILSDGGGCLIGNGRGQRITILPCDHSEPKDNELWTIDWLYPIA